jgi:hypothetical protein
MRKIILWLEFWFLLLVQLAIIVTYLTMLLPASARAASPEKAASNAAGAEPLAPANPAANASPAALQSPASHFKPIKLEAYLSSYPLTKSEAKLTAKRREAQSWGDTYSIARSFEHKMARRIAYDAGEHFMADCKAAGGGPELKANPHALASYYREAKKGPIAYDALARMCVRADGKALSALLATYDSDRWGDQYVHIYMMSPKGAADMQAVYQSAIKQQQQYAEKERRRQAELESRYRASLVIWAQWRKQLTIGSDTNCGPVIGLRGPMVEVANNAQALWFKREALFPVDARSASGVYIQCGAVSAY